MVKNALSLKLITLFGFIFLYAPIALLIVYSFNESRLVTVWSGFSFKWYVELFKDKQLLTAAWVSLRIALATAFGATILGTIAAHALSYYRKGHGLFFNLLLKAPLVMPEVITGFSLLLLFVALQQAIGFPAGRGMLTIWIAHMTLTVAYVTVIITVRLQDIDKTLFAAATDLGAKPMTIFTRITLPLISPALMGGWLMAFTLSFDDLVIASFTSGPKATTLPMVIYSSVRIGVSPKINALATIMITLVTVLAVVACAMLMRLQKRQGN